MINAGNVGTRQNEIVMAGFWVFVPNDDQLVGGDQLSGGIVEAVQERIRPMLGRRWFGGHLEEWNGFV